MFCMCTAGRTPTVSRQASRHETKDGVLLHSWLVSMKLTSASWLRPVCRSFHNLIRFNCSPFFASCRRHRVLTVTCLDACRCAAYLSVLPPHLRTETDPVSKMCSLDYWMMDKVQKPVIPTKNRVVIHSFIHSFSFNRSFWDKPRI
jgi:hypothetical protein